MKYIPGHKFNITRRQNKGFVLGETYTIYHIAPQTEGVTYIFYSQKAGKLPITFTSIEEAETIIESVSK